MGVFSIVLYSPGAGAFHEAVSFAAGARAQGNNVLIFLRGAALTEFVGQRWAPSSFRLNESWEALTASDLALLETIRSGGKTVVYACSAWARRLDLDSGTLASRVDAVVGLNAFLSQAMGGPILYL